MGGVPFTASGSSLTLQATAAPALFNGPVGRSLAKPLASIYTSTAPSIPMAAGSISGAVVGNLSGSTPVAWSGTPSTTITGNPTTVLSGTLTGSISGTTDAIGNQSPVPVPIMPPYVVMGYYIVMNGHFPTFDSE